MKHRKIEKAEHIDILNKFRRLVKSCSNFARKDEIHLIYKAFNYAFEAHKTKRRESGEPYIYHPISVAQVVAAEIGLDTKSVVCALLHDVVEDTSATLDDIEKEFGKVNAQIVDGLTKISGLNTGGKASLQAENFRKLLLTLSTDIRVILIKLADRLHNMRTLGSMLKEKQLKTASETFYLYAPLAHRLGLYKIKSELEDLSMRYTEAKMYNLIEKKLKNTTVKRNKYIREFTDPIENKLAEYQYKYEIKGRTKSIYSIWNKMKSQNVEFEEVYDIFAIRIILNTQPEEEKSECWKIYSLITDLYVPNPKRLRDWVSVPKSNGYESLHTTVVGPAGKWVEVQIRSVRMNEIAEKGFAAHWKYKGQKGEKGLDDWLLKIRDILETPEPDALEFVDDFKLNLYSKEIFVFTPNGDLRKLPSESTVLDFAFDIHTDIGVTCVGAKVNGKNVTLKLTLLNGDQVEILTSRNQKPKPEWLSYVVTSRAKTKIRQSIKEDRYSEAETGKELIKRRFKNWKVTYNDENISRLLRHFKLKNSLDFYYMIAIGKIDIVNVKDFLTTNTEKTKKESLDKIDVEKIERVFQKTIRKSEDYLIIDEELSNVSYKLGKCCNPIFGDDIFGFVTVSEGIKIHRVNCPNASQLFSRYAYRIIKARWNKLHGDISFETVVKVTGIDDIGIVNKISDVISKEMNINMKAISIESEDGMFEGTLKLYVENTKHLNSLIHKLKKIKGVIKAVRYDSK